MTTGQRHGRLDRLVEDSARTRVFGRKRFRLDGKERDRVKSGWNPGYLTEYDRGLSVRPVAQVEVGWFVYAYWSDMASAVSGQRRRFGFGNEASARKWAQRLPEGAQATVCQRPVDRAVDLSETRKATKARPVGAKRPVVDTSGLDFA